MSRRMGTQGIKAIPKIIFALLSFVFLRGDRFLLTRSQIVKDMQVLPELLSISSVFLGVIVLVLLT